MIDAPGLVESREHVALDHLVADVAKVSEQLMIVSLAVCQTFSLIMTIAEERFLTLGADKMFHAPVFPKGRDHPVLDGPPAGSTDRDPHLVVAAETVELVELLGGVAGPGPHLPGGAGQLYAAPRAVEVVGMVNLSSEPQRLLVNGRVTLLTHVLAHASSFDLWITTILELCLLTN